MSHFVNVFQLPGVQKIIEKSELKIMHQTGVQVKLKGFLVSDKDIINIDKVALQYQICQIFSVTIGQLKSKSRNQNIVDARYVYIYFLKNHYSNNLASIAKELNRHHSSIIHALSQINNYFKTGDTLIEKIENIKITLAHEAI